MIDKTPGEDRSKPVVLCDSANLERFKLWYRTRGMGGETMLSILQFSQAEGSAAMLRDFAALSERLAHIEERQRWLESDPWKQS